METLRLEEILVRDKFENVNNILKILQDEITPIAKNYFILSNDLIVRCRKDKDKFIFSIEMIAERIKPFGKIL